MKYLCLAFGEEAAWNAMSPLELVALEAAQRRFTDALIQSGDTVVAEIVQSTALSTTLRMRDGSLSLSCGPAVDVRGALRGLLLIEARDLNDAIRAVAKAPFARSGSIEVWPLRASDAP